MAISEQRLMLFALLSAFETDARHLIENCVCPDHSIKDDIGTTRYEQLAIRLRPSTSGASYSEVDLLDFLDIGDVIKVLLANRSLLPNGFSAALKRMAKRMEGLSAIRNRVMHQRPLEFDDLPETIDILRDLSKSNKETLIGTKDVFKLVGDGKLIEKFSQTFTYAALPAVLNNLPQPDFDDTGFMGRKEKVEELKKAVAGPYPVVTVLGVGGVGKSALALHVAYDILNDPEIEFDAIIWTTAKTARLTGADVEEILDAVSSSVGIARAAISEFGIEQAADPFEELTRLLSQFKVLLFIDNLETILDDRVRKFVREIPKGSKVVFTSRIGLGAYDYVVNLSNLDAKAARNFFQRVANVWKRVDLSSAPSETVTSYCVRLNNSPLGIKWFIHAVAMGGSIQKLLSNPKLLLDFCLENVVDKLSSNARTLLNVLAITAREQSPASLHYISDIDAWVIQDALRELIAANLVTVIPSTFGDEDRYKITILAQTFISKHHNTPSSLQAEVRKRQAQLTSLGERAESSDRHGFVYNPQHCEIRKEFSGTDSVAATYLRRAYEAAKNSDFEQAYREIESAKHIAATYFEVHRIEAQVAALDGNALLARACFEEAIALKRDHPPLNYWYATFLMKAMDDIDAAEHYLRNALVFDPSSSEVRIELSRCLLYKRRFSESWQILSEVDTSRLKNKRSISIYYDLLLQSCFRLGEDCLERSDWQQLVRAMSRFGDALLEVPDYQIDSPIERTLEKSYNFCNRCLQYGSLPQYTTIIEKTANLIAMRMPMAKWLKNENSQASQMQWLGGTVSSLVNGRDFGFLNCDNGQRLFFHKNSCSSKVVFDALRPGAKVEFTIGSNTEGPCAENIRPANDQIRGESEI